MQARTAAPSRLWPVRPNPRKRRASPLRHAPSCARTLAATPTPIAWRRPPSSDDQRAAPPLPISQPARYTRVPIRPASAPRRASARGVWLSCWCLSIEGHQGVDRGGLEEFHLEEVEVDPDSDKLDRPDRVIILDADNPMTEIRGRFVWLEEHARVVEAARRAAYAEGSCGWVHRCGPQLPGCALPSHPSQPRKTGIRSRPARADRPDAPSHPSLIVRAWELAVRVHRVARQRSKRSGGAHIGVQPATAVVLSVVG